jgi:hypothetical protein
VYCMSVLVCVCLLCFSYCVVEFMNVLGHLVVSSMHIYMSVMLLQLLHVMSIVCVIPSTCRHLLSISLYWLAMGLHASHIVLTLVNHLTATIVYVRHCIAVVSHMLVFVRHAWLAIIAYINHMLAVVSHTLVIIE